MCKPTFPLRKYMAKVEDYSVNLYWPVCSIQWINVALPIIPFVYAVMLQSTCQRTYEIFNQNANADMALIVL